MTQPAHIGTYGRTLTAPTGACNTTLIIAYSTPSRLCVLSVASAASSECQRNIEDGDCWRVAVADLVNGLNGESAGLFDGQRHSAQCGVHRDRLSNLPWSAMRIPFPISVELPVKWVPK